MLAVTEVRTILEAVGEVAGSEIAVRQVALWHGAELEGGLFTFGTAAGGGQAWGDATTRYAILAHALHVVARSAAERRLHARGKEVCRGMIGVACRWRRVKAGAGTAYRGAVGSMPMSLHRHPLVDSLVLGQVGTVGEAFAALVTDVGFSALVYIHMRREGGFDGKAFAALGTYVFLGLGVGSFVILQLLLGHETLGTARV